MYMYMCMVHRLARVPERPDPAADRRRSRGPRRLPRRRPPRPRRAQHRLSWRNIMSNPQAKKLELLGQTSNFKRWKGTSEKPRLRDCYFVDAFLVCGPAACIALCPRQPAKLPSPLAKMRRRERRPEPNNIPELRLECKQYNEVAEPPKRVVASYLTHDHVFCNGLGPVARVRPHERSARHGIWCHLVTDKRGKRGRH